MRAAHGRLFDGVQGRERRCGTTEPKQGIKELVDERMGLGEKGNAGEDLSQKAEENHDGEEHQKEISGRYGQKAEIPEKNPG